MTKLTELFPTATIKLDDLNELNALEVGTDEYGVARFRVILNFMMTGMQHHMAVQAQKVLETEGDINWNNILVDPADVYVEAAVDLHKFDQNAAQIAIDGIAQILPMVTNRLKSNPFTITSEDGTFIAIHVNNVFDTVEAA